MYRSEFPSSLRACCVDILQGLWLLRFSVDKSVSTEIEIRPTTTESTGMKNKSVEIPDSLRFLILGLEGSFLFKSNGSAKPSKNFLLLRSYSIVNNRGRARLHRLHSSSITEKVYVLLLLLVDDGQCNKSIVATQSGV